MQHDSDAQEITYESLKARLKKTRMGVPHYRTPPTEEAPATSAPAAAKESPSAADEVGTETVILDGAEIDLSNSAELTTDRVRQMLKRTQFQAQNHTKTTREIGQSNTPSRAFKTMRRKRASG